MFPETSDIEICYAHINTELMWIQLSIIFSILISSNSKIFNNKGNIIEVWDSLHHTKTQIWFGRFLLIYSLIFSLVIIVILQCFSLLHAFVICIKMLRWYEIFVVHCFSWNWNVRVLMKAQHCHFCLSVCIDLTMPTLELHSPFGSPFCFCVWNIWERF